MPLTISLGELVLLLLKVIDYVIDCCEKLGFILITFITIGGFFNGGEEEAQSMASAGRANCKEIL